MWRDVLKKKSLSTTLAQAGHFIDGSTGAVIPPIHPSTTFARGNGYELISDYS
jgi:cystathionine gamma-synthase